MKRLTILRHAKSDWGDPGSVDPEAGDPGAVDSGDAAFPAPVPEDRSFGGFGAMGWGAVIACGVFSSVIGSSFGHTKGLSSDLWDVNRSGQKDGRAGVRIKGAESDPR